MLDITDKHNDANRHQTIQFGHYHWTLESCHDNSPIWDVKKSKIEECGNDEDPISLHSREVSPVKKGLKN